MSVKTMSLEISEITHERQELIAVGTAVIRGEELPAIGRIYVLDVIDVVPEPDRPETGKKLKLIAKEEVKGAVTALSEIGTQGFLLAAQGQKCMVRGLKEDGTLLPVAFMDMQCYVSAMKELRGTGLCVMGDAIKGLWFAGYTEDPYQLRLFGKSPKHIEVIAADFLPDEKQLYIVAADSDCNIHILQFDPESKPHPSFYPLSRASIDKILSRPQIALGLPSASSVLFPHGAFRHRLHPAPTHSSRLAVIFEIDPHVHRLGCPRSDLPSPALLPPHPGRAAIPSPVHAAPRMRLESEGVSARRRYGGGRCGVGSAGRSRGWERRAAMERGR